MPYDEIDLNTIERNAWQVGNYATANLATIALKLEEELEEVKNALNEELAEAEDRIIVLAEAIRKADRSLCLLSTTVENMQTISDEDGTSIMLEIYEIQATLDVLDI